VPNYITKKGVLYFNPGSCGTRRFELPITLGLLELVGVGFVRRLFISAPNCDTVSPS